MEFIFYTISILYLYQQSTNYASINQTLSTFMCKQVSVLLTTYIRRIENNI
ncbi:hypothetical protein Hanom_Chr06g00523631 [Helianthus anomalus]